MKTTHKIILFIFLFLNVSSFGQNNIIDSLKKLISQPVNDTIKIKAFNSLSQELNNSKPEEALKYSNIALELSKSINYEAGIALSLISLGQYNVYNGKIAEGLRNYEEASKIYDKIHNKRGISETYSNIAVVYSMQGKLPNALEYLLKALKINEQLNDEFAISKSLNHIALIYKDMGNIEMATKYHIQALNLSRKINDKKGIMKAMGNLGVDYRMNKNYEKALEYYFQTIKLADELNDKRTIGIVYSNIGSLYQETKNYDKALYYQFKSLNIKKEIRYKRGISYTYYNIAEIYFILKKYNETLQYAQLSLDLSKELEDVVKVYENYKLISQTYEKIGKFKEAYYNFFEYNTLKDSVTNENSQKRLYELQTLYESDKKQKEIEFLNVEKGLKDVELNKERVIRNFLIIGFSLMIVLFFIIFHSFRKIRKANNLLGIQRNEILEKNEELQQQKEEIFSQRNALEELNHNLENRVKEEVSKNRDKDLILIHQSKHAAMGEMIGNIAHQWRQPLNAVGVLIQNMQEAYEYGELNDEYIQKSVTKGMSLVQHMSRTIDDFRNFFKADKEKVDFNINITIEKAISFVEASFRNYNIIINLNVDKNLTANGYPNEMVQVILNILNNAKDALLEHKVANPEINIKLEKHEQNAYLTINDNAGGIPDDIIDKIFEPYFTTKNDENGTGLGLYMSKNIIEKNMNGYLSVRNNSKGAEFEIVL